MVMVVHEAIGVDLKSKALMGFCQRFQKSLVIRVLVKNPLGPSPTIHDMVIRILILESERPRHTVEPTRIKILSQILTPLVDPFSSFHEATGKHLSLMKLMRYLRQNLGLVRELLDLQTVEAGRLEAIGRYCTYEKRKRTHFVTTMEQALATINSAEGLA